MARVTNRVDPAGLGALLARPARAGLAFERAGAVGLAPVAYRFHAGRHQVGVARADGDEGPTAGARASLVVDDGWRWFELRAVVVRGTLAPVDAPPGAPAGLAWFEVVPERITGWDYATLHAEAER